MKSAFYGSTRLTVGYGQILPLACGILMALIGTMTNRAEAQIFDWNSPFSGTFFGGPWAPATPTFTAGTDETLNFGSFLEATVPGYSVTDSGNIFTRVINFNNNYGSPSISIATSGTLTFNSAGGQGAQLNQNGFGTAIIGAFTMADDLLIGGSGEGNLIVDGGITNSGNVLTINQTGGGFSNTGAILFLNSAGIWGAGGTTVISGGNIAIGNTTALGSAASNTVTFNAGSLRFEESNMSLANNFVLNNTMTVLSASSGFATTNNTFAGVMSGTGGLNIAPVNGLVLNLTGANTFSGDVIYRGTNNAVGFGVTLAGENGSIANVNNITMTANSLLRLDNSIAPAAARLNANATLNLNAARLTHDGNATIATGTTIGTLNSLGQARITVNPGANSLSGAGSTLTIGTWNRSENSTAYIIARDLGQNPGANVGTFVLTNDPGGEVGGILPYAVANISGSSTVPVNTFVRRDAITGRLIGLNLETDYQGGLPATQVLELYRNQNIAANYRATKTQAGLGDTTVNALILDTIVSPSPLVGTSIAGEGTLNVTSGAIINSGSIVPNPIRSTIAVKTLNFGSNTGHIHTAPIGLSTSSNLNIVSTITGTGGLVKSGEGELVLAGNNTFSGDVYINAGLLSISSDSNLGDSSNSIRINSGNGILRGLVFEPNAIFTDGTQTSLTTSRNISLGESGGSILVTNTNNTMTVNGQISGSGILYKAGSGTLRLNNNNTYTGETFITTGVLVAAHDASLGNSSSNIIFGQGSSAFLQAGSSFTSDRNILGLGQMNFFTNGHNLTLNGVLGTQSSSNSATLSKQGTGDLILTNTNTYAGATIIGDTTGLVIPSEMSGAQTGGRLILSGANGSIAMSDSIAIHHGSTLRLDNSSAVNNFRVGMVTVSMNAGSFEVIGNAATDSTTAIGALNSSTFANTISLDQSAGTGNTLNSLVVGSYTIPDASQISFVRGDNLGSKVGNRTSLLFNSAPSTVVAGILPSFVGSGSVVGSPTEFLKLGTPSGGQTPLEIFTDYAINAPGAGATSVADITSNQTLGAASVIGAVRLSTGNVDLAGSNWNVQSGSIITTGSRTISNSGTSASLILGGTTTGGGAAAGFGRIINNGNLTIGSNVTLAATEINKFGAGELVLNQASTATTWNVSQGALRYGVAGALPSDAIVNLAPGTSLDFNNHTTTLSTITGYGSVNIGSGNLTLMSQNENNLAGSINGSGSINFNITPGASQLSLRYVLTGDNTGFTGEWNVESGTLVVGSNHALGSGRINLGSATPVGNQLATLLLPTTAPNVLINNDIVVRIGGGQKQLVNGAVTTSGLVTGNGTLTGNITLNNNAPFRLEGSASTTAQPTGAWTLAGNISGPGDIDFRGGDWNLWGENSGWSGDLRLVNSNSSVLGIGSDTALGTGRLIMSSEGGRGGGMLRADNGARTLSNRILLTPSKPFTITGKNDITLNGDMSLSGAGFTYTFNVVNSGLTTFNGRISTGSGSGFVQTGFGTLILGGDNVFGGGYNLSSGVLGIGSDTALGSNRFTIDEGGVVLAANGSRNISNLVTVNGHFAVAGSNALNFAGNIDLGTANRTAVVNNSALTSFAGIISGAGGGLSKEGTGVLAITNDNTYTGLTSVNEGTLFVNNSSGSGTGTGNVAVATGATLGGTGSMSGTVVVDGILSPGISIESLASGTLIMNAGSTFLWETLDRSEIGADLMEVLGELTLQGVNLDLSVANLAAGSWIEGDKLTLFSYAGTQITSGLVGYLDDSEYTFGSNVWVLNYNDVTAGLNFNRQALGPNYVTLTLTAVPEPASTVLFGLTTVVAMLCRRRRAS